MTADEYRRLAAEKRPKYGNRAEGGYASALEARRAAELKLLEAAGEISGLREQVPFEIVPEQRDASGKLLERAATYVADFTYERGGEPVVEDVKGMKTSTYRLKRKLMLRVHGIRILETR
jgi:hypothetical protein